MAFTLAPDNVNSPILTAVALAAPAADFTDGAEVGLKRPVKLTVEPVTVGMSSENDLLDAVRAKMEVDSLQNRIADLAAAYAYAQTGVQMIGKSAAGNFWELLGADLNDEALMGLDFEYVMKNNEAYLKLMLQTELGIATFKALEKTATTKTWSATDDPTKRRRAGIKKVLFGGAPVGIITDFSLSAKSRSVMAQGGRPILSATEITAEIIMGQTQKADVDAAIDAANGEDTIACYFWNGEQVNFTTLRGGKIPTLDYADKHQVKIAIKALIAKGDDRVDFTGGAGTIANFTLLDNEPAV
jgi:hypothetical protein